MNVNIFYQTDVTGIIKKACLAALAPCAKKNAEVNIIFVDEKEILRVNKTYLNHHYVTDVISFNHPRPPFDIGAPTTRAHRLTSARRGLLAMCMSATASRAKTRRCLNTPICRK